MSLDSFSLALCFLSCWYLTGVLMAASEQVGFQLFCDITCGEKSVFLITKHLECLLGSIVKIRMLLSFKKVNMAN